MTFTPAQCRAARGLLGWTQRTLSANAHIAVSTIADFERGARRPTYNNRLAMRTALEKAGVCFIVRGVWQRERASREDTAQVAQPMPRGL